MIEASVKSDITGLDRFSFSKMSSIRQCPYSYDLSYNYHKRGEQNCFAECGSFVHEILEKYLKGELLQCELKDYFLSKFEETVPNGVNLITSSGYSVPLTDKYINQIASFLENFDGFYIGGKKLDVLGVEKKFTYVLSLEQKGKSIPFILTGVLDVVGKDHDGNLYILDHKSKAGFKTKEERSEYARQLYLYSIYVKHEYGDFPKAIIFDMFRIDKLDIIPFNKKAYDEALEWAAESVAKAQNEELFLPIDFSVEIENFRKAKSHYDDLEYDYAGRQNDRKVRAWYREARKSLEDKLFFCMNLCDHKDVCDTWRQAQAEYLEIERGK